MAQTNVVELLPGGAAVHDAGSERPWWDAVVETPPGEQEAEIDDDRPWADAVYHAPRADYA